MPKYGFFRYGTSVYGNLLRETSQSQLFAQAIDYGKVRVTILSGPRVGSGYLLVRTKNGSAFDPSQGVVIASGVITAQEFSVTDGVTNFEDDNESNDVAVPTGSVFYTLFVIEESGKWIKDAATSLFSPADKGTLAEFLKILPPVLTTSTGNPLDVPETSTDLARFLGGLAVTYDEFQTEIDAMLPSRSRKSSVLRGLHESLARSAGMPVEFTIGVAASAKLFRDAGFIYRQKGTLSGLTAYTEALTSWPTRVYDSPNMIRYLDDASFEDGVGRWQAAGAALVSQPAGGETYQCPELPHDYFLSPFSSRAIGLITLTENTATLRLPLLEDDDEPTSFSSGRRIQSRAECIPVRGEEEYFYSAFVRPYVLDSEGEVSLAVRWVDQHGDVISDAEGTALDLADASDWVRIVQPFTAPESAAFAKLEVRISGTVDDEIGLDSLQFSDTDTHYHDPRTVTVICGPTRLNLLTDGNFALGSTWTAQSGTAERDPGGLFGTHCLSLSGEFSALSESVPARPGLLLNFSAYFLGDETDIVVEYLDTDGEPLDLTPPVLLDDDGDPVELPEAAPDRYSGITTTEASEEWRRTEVTALVPEGAEFVRVRISGNGDVLMDAAMLERSESARIYFDADTGDESGEDVIVANVDGHVYPMLYPSRLSRFSRLRATLPFYLPMGVSARVLLWDSDDPAVTDFLPYGN
jgi:hypothetical protein